MEFLRLIGWIIMRNQPLADVDTDISQSTITISCVCSKSLLKYILNLVSVVESTIAAELPNKIRIMFNR